MAPVDGIDPEGTTSPIPLDGDGHELIGNVIDGRYRLEATLGRGGMGLVYRATHINLRRQVAVKILHPSLAASPDVRNRFEREALAVGRVDHPNCVATYDVGRLGDGALYLAMELLEGKSLADVLETERQIAPGRALHILAHILRGLGQIHASGLIHRDIKPENIFLIRQGSDEDFAKILDFGIAKPMSGELDDGVRLTQAGMAFGTPIYMAPEQALGNPMDGRADLYAAAVIAYEMLCGQPPFYSEDKLEVMSMHAGKPVPAMRSRLIKGGKPVPSSIEKLIVRGLTKKPADRYATAEVFLAAVEHALHTPDGGQTEVNFERPEETGARPLLTDDGELRGLNDSLVEPPGASSIADDIDEVLAATPTRPQASVPSKSSTGSKGQRAEAKPARAQPAKAQPKPQPAKPQPVQPVQPVQPSRQPKPSSVPVPRNTTPGVGVPAPRPARPSTPGLGVTPTRPTAATTASAADRSGRLATKLGIDPPVVAAGDARGRLAGGVGIGLPYTGPAGEPIFGLTPEQRLAQVPKRRRWKLWAVIGGVAVLAAAAGITFAIVTAPGDDNKLDPSSPAGQASQALASGQPNQALQILKQHESEIGNDPDAQLVEGHTYAALHESAEALAAYARALALEPDKQTDPALRANLRVMAADKNPTIVESAFDVWVGATKDPDGRTSLYNAAVSEDIDRRHAAYHVIDRYKLGDGVDWVTAYSLDLEEEKTCELRKQAVDRLHAKSDPSAIPALERAIEKKIKTGSMRGKPYSACLIDDARATIGYLRGLKKP